ncbi:hypothetical protein [Micromonospora mirobrigensis]|uniref:DUF1579 domain-containing protein n=1 Tax=Micromonospora mirobrigensis TaxID=262898 RepID=A0A1C5APV5_9ACTN|nr:hypothetical protein [Micromonospora mirobrigensis]SCF47173.1 hypothetical protein GA0070564_1177 [Micromonospora mirobrigensis]
MILPDFVGNWTGTNGFRPMPADPLSESPATATVTAAASGHLTSIGSRWEHPDDGPQDGLTIAWTADDGSLAGVWSDSWHQKPAPMSLAGGRGADGIIALDGGYGDGWVWRIVFDTTEAETFQMRMDNVVPTGEATAELPAGPYPAMVLQARRG